MTDLKALAAAALGTTPDNIHTAVEVGDELVALDRNLAKYRWPMATLLKKAGLKAARAASPPTDLSLPDAVALAVPAAADEPDEEPVFDEPLESQETPVETEESILVEPTEPETEEPSLACAADEPPVKKSRRR